MSWIWHSFSLTKVLDSLDLKANLERTHPLALLANAVKLIAEKESAVFCPVLHTWCSEAGMIAATLLYQLFSERLVFEQIIIDTYPFITIFFLFSMISSYLMWSSVFFPQRIDTIYSRHIKSLTRCQSGSFRCSYAWPGIVSTLLF